MFEELIYDSQTSVSKLDVEWYSDISNYKMKGTKE